MSTFWLRNRYERGLGAIMDIALLTAAVITLFGGIVGFLASLLTEGLSTYLKKYTVRKVTVKVGPYEVELSDDPEKTLQEITEKISQIQEHPRVFLSYANVDKEFAQRLAKDLRSLDIDVWMAEEQIQAGDSISRSIKDGLSSSQWMIVLISENLPKSNYVNRELAWALADEQRRERTFVIPALIEGDQLPQELEDKAYADFRQSYDVGFASVLSALKRSPVN